jgi:hypothetical protein
MDSIRDEIVTCMGGMYPFVGIQIPISYRIGMFEISEDMIDKANTIGSLGITKDIRGKTSYIDPDGK